MGNDIPESGDSQNVNATLFQNRDFHLVPKHENVPELEIARNSKLPSLS